MPRFPVFLVLCLVLVPAVVDAGDLFRIRFATPPPLYPGCTIELQVVVDHLRYPFPGPPLDPRKALEALSFGITLPAPLQYVGHHFEGTTLKNAIGKDPDFAGIAVYPGVGITAGIVLDFPLIKTLPEGASQVVMKVIITAPPGTPQHNVAVGFTDVFGNPRVPLEFHMPAGIAVPFTLPTIVSIQNGTCMVPAPQRYTPAAVGQLADEDKPEESTPDRHPLATDDVDFPEPTEDELKVEWLYRPDEAEATPTVQAIGGGGPPMMMLGNAGLYGALPDADDCTFLDETVNDVPPSVEVDIEVGGIGNEPTISDALVIGFGDPENVDDLDWGWIIQVNSGTHFDNITIDPDLFPNGLTIFSADGPDDTTIEADVDGERILTITGEIAESGRINFGLASGSNSATDWHGFTITGSRGGGILIDATDTPVLISGNIITGLRIEAEVYLETAPPEDVKGGAGIAVRDSSNVYIVENEISNNIIFDDGIATDVDLKLRGAGIYQDSSSTWIGRNVIKNNRFANEGADEGRCLGYERFGGGVFMQAHGVVFCDNRVSENAAVQGAGLYLRAGAGAFSEKRIHLELNEIFNNTGHDFLDPEGCLEPDDLEWCPGYAGGGIRLEIGDVDDGPSHITILRNDIHDNSCFAPEGVTLAAMCDDGTGMEQGGALYIEGRMEHAADPDLYECGGPVNFCTEVNIEGNHIYENDAIEGAGIWLFADLDDEATDETGSTFVQLLNNTIARNGDVVSTGDGGGLYIAADSLFVGSGNVFDANLGDSEWYAECDQDYSSAFTFSQMPNHEPAVCAAGSFDLFGDDCSASDPKVVRTPELEPEILGFGSPCVDSADIGLDLTIVLDNNGDARLIDYVGVQDDPADPYTGTELDRGADELVNGPKFKRGDANNNGTVSGLQDGLFLLHWQFLEGDDPPCMKAADANGNDAVSGLTDGLYLFFWNFVEGADPPPAPGPDECGHDGDPDNDTDCADETACP